MQASARHSVSQHGKIYKLNRLLVSDVRELRERLSTRLVWLDPTSSVSYVERCFDAVADTRCLPGPFLAASFSMDNTALAGMHGVEH
jgi:hypothetical protein